MFEFIDNILTYYLIGIFIGCISIILTAFNDTIFMFVTGLSFGIMTWSVIIMNNILLYLSLFGMYELIFLYFNNFNLCNDFNKFKYFIFGIVCSASICLFLLGI